MNSKERLRCALRFGHSDQIPIDFGSTAVTGMHVYVVDGLRRYYGLKSTPVKVIEPYQMLGQIDEELQDVLGVDVIGVSGSKTMFGFSNRGWKSWRMPNGLEVSVPKGFQTTVDDAGNTYIYPQGDLDVSPSGRMPQNGYFFDAIIRQPKLDEQTLNPKDNTEEFSFMTKDEREYFDKSIKQASSTDQGLVVTPGGMGLGDIALVPAPFLKHPKGIRDVEEWYISTVTRPEYIKKVFEYQTHVALENLKKLHRIGKDAIDVIFLCGTDFGTQTGLFTSPAVFSDLYLPYYKKMNDWIHENTKWFTMKHSCGAVEPLIDLMIEAGFDILNPVQCSASGMDAKTLKDKYHGRIAFWGGGVDTQQLLAFGTPAQIKQQVQERCAIFSKGGGFVFNAIHNVQADTPIENVVAMIEAVREYNLGR